jgi:predicted RNase H-like HicB family nuclease
LEDGTFFGRIPSCKGVVAFAASLRQCEDELRSVLEDWVLVGLKLGHDLPILDSLDLNRNPEYESLGFAHEILKLNDLCSKSSTTSAK